eukprot:CAMPEP_0118933484 /NCGR_PEP_ID=MMETSP1169-20130426/12011_1 /TAXON_ID=36882 /ORGANISM="Pyramimonas obovata, Strain CCMP722" /LENGTH=668 /DNA_ID=CAMNT_0006876245 /DNA_START=85 /DNA_END=2091 /DNA_ORIENTATION=+
MAITHDPGPAGPSGEGESLVVFICLTFLVAVAHVFRHRIKRALGMDEENEDNLDDAKVVKIESGDGKTDGEGENAQDSDAIELDQLDELDRKAQEAWTQPEPYNPSPEWRLKFIQYASCGTVQGNVDSPQDGSPAFKFFYFLSGVNWMKVFVFFSVWFLIWLFLECLGLMGTGFKLLGGKDSAKLFDVVDNPISGLMIGILSTVLVQSSSTTTSIIIGLVGADEMSVSTAIPMVMGANIGTSVTNTLVAMGHFANKDELRRGFAGATVHDCFNLLSVSVLLPLQWASDFLGEMSYEMAKGATSCDEDSGDDCEKTEFLKPYLKPYYDGVAKYDKKIATYVSQGYCDGQCQDSPSKEEKKALTDLVCKKGDTDLKCDPIEEYKGSWKDDDIFKKKRMPAYIRFDAAAEKLADATYLFDCPLADKDACEALPAFWNRTDNVLESAVGAALAAKDGQVFKVCEEMKYGLCDKPLLKGGIMLTDWDLDDDSAGALATFLSITGICVVLYLLVQSLNILIKGQAARFLRKAVSLNGYLSMLIGVFVTIMVQSSSITTSVLTPLVAVGLVSIEEMFPLTLGANIGTTVTGILAATVVTSNPVEAWQVALCHLFFNLFGIAIWYPIPVMRRVPLNMAKYLGSFTGKYTWFPLAYVGVVFFVIPGIVYGIAVAATS